MFFIDKRITIKDISQKTGLSAGTIHRALTGKKGVSFEVGEKIKMVAEEMGYKPNFIASSLKRKTITIVASFPSWTELNRFYFSFIWQGFRECIAAYEDYNISVIELPYTCDMQNKMLISVFERLNGEIHGLVTYASDNITHALDMYSKANIPVVFVGRDASTAERLFFIRPDYFTTGKIAAEILTSYTDSSSGFLLCTGDMNTLANYMCVDGFMTYMQEQGLNLIVKTICVDKDIEKANKQILNELSAEDCIRGAFSTTARSTAAMCNAVVNSGIKNLKLIGSDVFNESIQFLKQGVLGNILYKSPRLQAFKATQVLLNYLIKNEKPSKELVFMETQIVFKSNLHLYEEEMFNEC